MAINKKESISEKQDLSAVRDDVWRPTYCWTCFIGPCLVKVHRVDGVAVNVQGNLDDPSFEELTRNKGRICAKSYGMVEKLYNPHRIKNPLKRTNPEKGRDIDPQWVEISWEEALDTVAEKMKAARAKSSMRVCSTLTNIGKLGIMGTWIPFYNAFGPMQDIKGGSSIRCGLGVHTVGQTIHGSYRCAPDMTYCKYLLLVGSNLISSGGTVGNYFYHQAKKVAVDPVLSLTAAKADRWLPIKPGTDTAFFLSLIHVILHEINKYDAPFLKTMTVSPFLVGDDGYFILDGETKKALIWDCAAGKARVYDDPEIKDEALEGSFLIDGQKGRPSLQVLKDQVRECTPEWAAAITEIDAAAIRTIAAELVDNAQIGSTIDIDGVTMPYRPVDVIIGRPVESDVHCYQNILCQHILVALLGALETVGGHKGGSADRNAYDYGITPGGAHGTPKFETYPFAWPPDGYDATATLLPFLKIWGHPYHLVLKNMVDPPPDLPMPPFPEVYLRWRSNTLTSSGAPELVEQALLKIPFIISISYVQDEVTQLADLVLPDHTELEKWDVCFELSRRATSGREFKGTILRQPIVEPVVNSRDISDICTALAGRIGILADYNRRINLALALKDPYRLEPDQKYSWQEIISRACRSLTNGEKGLEWFSEHAALIPKLKGEELYPAYHKVRKNKMRFPVPYMEHVKRVGEELANNLASVGITWWTTEDYTALPVYNPSVLNEVPAEYDFFVTTCRTPVFANSTNVDLPRLIEISGQIRGQQDIVINAKSARRRGIKEGDTIWLESPAGKVSGRAVLTEGIRPDTILIASNFGQWQTPVARETGRPSMNNLLPISYEWTDRITGSMQATVKAKVYKDKGREQ